MEPKAFFSKNNIAQVFFFLAFMILLFVDYVSATYVSLFTAGRMIQIALLLLFCKLALTSYGWKEWIAIALLLTLGLVSYLTTDSYTALEFFLFVIAAKGVDKRKAVKFYLMFVGGITLAALAASLTGVFGEAYQILNFRGNGEELRYCFGYNHPNSCHIVYLQLALAAIWLYYEKMKWYHLIPALVLNGILAFFTDSRTGLLLGTVMFIFLGVIKIWNKLKQSAALYWLDFIALAGSLVMSVLAVTVGVKNPLLQAFDKLWTGRILYAGIEASKSRVSLMSDVDLQISCDMGFVKLFYNYGVVIFVIFLAAVIWQLYLNKKSKDAAELLLLLTALIFLFGEKFSSGEFITRNILVVFMIGIWRVRDGRKRIAEG